MRVTMLVRCLAMMRGGGETRHLAWMRELETLGVEVDVIAGQPLMLGGARHPVTGVTAEVIRSPYVRDAVYRWHSAASAASRCTRCISTRNGFAAPRGSGSPGGRCADIVHAHALYQAARLRRRDIPVVINFPGEPHARYLPDIQHADALIADGWAAINLPAVSGGAWRRFPRGSTPDCFDPEARVSARLSGWAIGA